MISKIKYSSQKTKDKEKQVIFSIANEAKKTFILFRKVPLLYMLVPLLLTWFFVYLKFFYYKEVGAKTTVPSINKEYNSYLKQHRNRDFRLTHPLLMSEELNEAGKLQQLKQQVNNTITNMVASRNIQSASVYLCVLNNAQWFCINSDDEFIPASLMKVPLMMAYLKDAESVPGLLNKRLLFETPKIEMPVQTYSTDPTVVGNYYTVRELISNMIIYSDNNAAYLLQKYVSVPSFQKIFTSIGLPAAPFIDANFRMRIKDYSKLFHLLYDGNYLSKENSEYALELLSKAVFNKGITRNLPEGITVAHKFGETNELPNSGLANQLNETAIIYFDNNPVLVAVFTKGRDKERMSHTLSSVSQQVFDYFNSRKQ